MANRTYFQLFMYTAAGIVCIVEVVDSARRVALILLTDVIDNLTAYNYKKDWLPKAGAIIHGAVIILYIFIFACLHKRNNWFVSIVADLVFCVIFVGGSVCAGYMIYRNYFAYGAAGAFALSGIFELFTVISCNVPGKWGKSFYTVCNEKQTMVLAANLHDTHHAPMAIATGSPYLATQALVANQQPTIPVETNTGTGEAASFYNYHTPYDTHAQQGYHGQVMHSHNLQQGYPYGRQYP